MWQIKKHLYLCLEIFSLYSKVSVYIYESREGFDVLSRICKEDELALPRVFQHLPRSHRHMSCFVFKNFSISPHVLAPLKSCGKFLWPLLLSLDVPMIVSRSAIVLRFQHVFVQVPLSPGFTHAVQNCSGPILRQHVCLMFSSWHCVHLQKDWF